MISLVVDLVAETVKLARPVTLKAGGDVPVRVQFIAAPGDLSSIEFALGSDAETASVLAFTDTFTAENATLWTATLDASDTRLAAVLSARGSISSKAELVTTIAGKREVWPNVTIVVQRPVITPPATSEGGGTYYTQTQIDTLLAAAALNVGNLAALNLSTLPTSNPGSGKLWLNGGVLQVGA